MSRFVYADNAATTRIADEVLKEMMPFLTENYGNASSLYSLGVVSSKAIIKARQQVADAIHAEPGEIIFTGGGSEADNWLKPIARSLAKKGKKHIITSCIEHHALLHSMARLEKEGFTVTYLGVDSEGFVSPQEFKQAITPQTGLASIMFANNEIGTLQPILEIGQICRENGILFHTDAVQAVGHVPVDVKALGVDFLSMSAHKFHGPKGMGAFFCRRGLPLDNLLDGGAQERGKRAGTENVAGIVGMGKAIELACASMEENTKKLAAMQGRLIDGILSSVPLSRLNGSRSHRLPGNVNISFLGVEGEALLLRMDLAGIMASSGSACASASLDPSHVLLAIGLKHEVAHGSVRLSLSDYNTQEDVDYILETLPAIVKTLRDMSPLWEEIVKVRA